MTNTDDQVGDALLRSSLFDKTVKGFAEASYKFKQSLSISTTGAWKNFFWREDPDALAAQSGNAIKGIPRGAEFPQASVEWQRIQTVIQKYGLEDFIYWEDILSDDVDVRNRTLFRIAEGVVKAVDDEIWVQLEGDKTTASVPVSIQYFNVKTQPWNESSAAIIDNLMKAKQKIAEKNYDTSNLECWVSPRDYRSAMKFLVDKGAQFPSLGTEVARNGRSGKIAGVQLIVSNSVTVSNALVVVPKRCATWKQLVPLKTVTMTDEFKGVKVRSVEMGVTQLTDPNACVLIMGTQGTGA